MYQVIFLCLCLAKTWTLVHAAHSRQRVVVRTVATPKYDRSITTFDPSGRLLQVEYGMEASNRGVPILALKTDHEVFVFIRQAASASMIPGQKVHRIDEHIWIFTAGFAGDARVLASSLRSFCQRHRLSMGEAPTTSEVAREAAALQHELTRVGGARPLGCTAIVAGVDVSMNGETRLFRTDPGGVMEDCNFCAAGKDQDLSMNILEETYDACVAADGSTPALLQAVTKMETKDGVDDRLELWSLKRDSFCRGQVRGCCFLNVRSNTFGRIESSLARAREQVTTI